MKYRWLRPAAIAFVWLVLTPRAALADGPSWEQWQPVPGAVDVDGPRSDGSLVVAGSGALYLLAAGGTLEPFARGPGGYREDPGLETYLAVSPGARVDAAGCDFAPDDIFILRLHTPIGINRVSAAGDESGSFANVPGALTLGGIAFDTGGSFGHRLLVLALKRDGRSFVVAVDCNGGVQTIAASLPRLEGGMAVAPAGFGSFGGDLVIPDETGRIVALSPDGRLTVVTGPRLPAGVDRTLGGLGFVPDGFTERGAFAFHADHKTPGSSVLGTDSLLRLGANTLAGAGVQDGDLLAAAEGGGAVLDVRCVQVCAATRVFGAGRAHAEGHIAFTVNPAQPSPVPAAVTRPLIPPGAVDFAGQWGLALFVVVVGLAFGVTLGVQAFRRRSG